MTAKTVIINQARMSSTRLPGKVLKTVLGKPLLAYQLERLLRSSAADAVVVATTTRPEDDPIVELCGKLGVGVSRGSEDDVLSRYYDAARSFSAGRIVRVTADCPLLDPAIVDSFLRTFADSGANADYLTSVDRGYPRGMACEVFSFEALERTHREAQKRAEREHVTLYMYSSPETFAIRRMPPLEPGWEKYRWTVDTPEDFELVRRILETLYPNNPCFTWRDCVQTMKAHPDWIAVNQAVVQKDPWSV